MQLKATAKEQIEVMITEIQIEKINLGENVTLQTMHDNLPSKSSNITVNDYNETDKYLTGSYNVNGTVYNYIIDKNFVVTIGEKAEIKPETVSFGDLVWNNGKASVEIRTKLADTIQYQVNGTDGTWINGTIVTDLSLNDVVYARLTNGIYVTEPERLTIIDSISPEDFIIETSNLTYTSVDVSGSTVDNESGLKYYTYVALTSTGSETKFEHITDTSYTVSGLSQGEEYIVYMIAYDNAGNAKKSNEVNVTTLSVPDSTTEGAITFSSETWTSGKANVTISTNTNLYIEYQINGTNGEWTRGASKGASVTVSNLNNNDVVYARLAEGTVSGKYTNITILDNTAPQSFSVSANDVSSTELKISASTTDNESGIKGYEYYVYEEDNLIDKSELINTTTYNVTSLTAGKTYTIYVIAYDYVGNSTKSEELQYEKQELYTWEKFSSNLETSYSSLYLKDFKLADTKFSSRSFYVTVSEIISDDKSLILSKASEKFIATGRFTFDMKSGSMSKSCLMTKRSAQNFSFETTGRFVFGAIDPDNTEAIYYITGYSSYYLIGYQLCANEVVSYSKGTTSYGTVSSNNKDAYPENGYSGGYWYVLQ